MSVMDQVITDLYAIYNGDCIEVLKGVASESVHLSIYSPPFLRFISLFIIGTGSV
jgi:DNA modification methylase